MTKQKEQLKTFGFTQLPSFDPDYFQHRARLGYLLLLNERDKLSYQVYTINAYSCLYSARKVVEGEYADRAQDLREALKESALEDWVVYFRPQGLYPGLRQTVSALIEDYRSLNTLRPRVNPDEATWAYQVFHDETQRTLVVSSNKPLTDEDAIGKFLCKWRLTLDQALNRKAIELPAYYKGCEQIALATRQWMSGKTTSFSLIEAVGLAGTARHEVVKHTARENTRQAHLYKKALNA